VKPAPFQYHRPESIDEVIACLAELDDAKLLAGGQSLMPMMNFRYLAPAHLVDLNRVSDLVGLSVNGGTLTIGAMTRQRDLLDSELVCEHCPLLADALRHVGHLPTRNRGTIGGSLSHLDPAAELPAVLAAHDAILDVRGPNGGREVAIVDWVRAYMMPALECDELLCSIRIPLWPTEHGHAFDEIARRAGDFAIAGAGALLSTDREGVISRVAIALTGVDVGPFRLTAAERELVGRPAAREAFARAAEHARAVPGMDDVHASSDYRRRLALVVVRRALERALLTISSRCPA